MKPHRIKQQNRTKITYLPLNTSKKQSKEELFLLFRPQLTLIYQKKLCAREGYITFANANSLEKGAELNANSIEKGAQSNADSLEKGATTIIKSS